MQDYERYITVQEAAKRLGRPEPEILRMLETGALPAMLRAELASKDGTPIGFDFARLPPEGVARVVDQGGDDFTLEWQYCGGHGKAVCFPAREGSIRVLWEPSLFPELMPQSEDAHPAATPTHGELLAPVAKVGADVDAGTEKLTEAAPKKRVLVLPLQQESVISVIRKLGHDPLRLPDREKGKRGVRAEVTDYLLKNERSLFQSQRMVRRAWDELRKSKQILGGK